MLRVTVSTRDPRPACGDARLIALSFPMDHHIDSDAAVTEALRARFKCAGCRKLFRANSLGLLGHAR